MPELEYRIVVPALVLRSAPGEQQRASIECGPDGIALGSGFCIECWFRPDAYPRQAETSVFSVQLANSTGGRCDLALRLSEQRIAPEFQGFHGPIADPPPLGKWTHVAVAFARGRLETTYWQGDDSYQVGVADLADERYRMLRLLLEPENEARMAFAELRVWDCYRDIKDLGDCRRQPIEGWIPYPVGYWKLDAGAGTVIADSSRNMRDGLVDGGEWQRDSGLELRLGELSCGNQSQGGAGGRSFASFPAQWIDPPRLELQLKHYSELAASRQSARAERSAGLQTARLELAALETGTQREEEALLQRQRQLADSTQRKRDAIASAREQAERRRDEKLARIASSRRIRLRDFILRLQEDLALGRERIRSEYGRMVGLDRIAVEIRMVPGVGGVGLHLPDPDIPIDPDRLSTLKLRFGSAPPEDEDHVRLASVPPLEGSTELFARRKLAEAGFRVAAVYQEVADPADDGRVLAQIYDAAEDHRAVLDSVVTLVVGRRR